MELPPAGRRVYLVRHAESERLGTPYAMDPGLTARGEAQLAALRAHAAAMTVDAIVCSELVRAQRTAQAIAAAHGRVPLIDPDWNELHTVGCWRDHSAAVAEPLFAKPLFGPDDRGVTGESLRELHRRVLEAWQRLLARPERNLVVVSHNGALGRLVQALLGLAEDAPRTSMISYPHAAITELWLLDRDYDPSLPGRITVALRIADASHLPAALVTR